MAAGRTGVFAAALIYAFIINLYDFNGAGYLHKRNPLTQLCNCEVQKHFGLDRGVLLSTFIRPGMEIRAANKQYHIRADRQRGELLIIVFSLLLAGDIHQCPGPSSIPKPEVKSPTMFKSITVSDHPALQVHTNIRNTANPDIDYPPDLNVCSSSALESMLAADAAGLGLGGRPGGMATAMEGEGESPAPERGAAALTSRGKQRRFRYTAGCSSSGGIPRVVPTTVIFFISHLFPSF